MGEQARSENTSTTNCIPHKLFVVNLQKWMKSRVPMYSCDCLSSWKDPTKIKHVDVDHPWRFASVWFPKQNWKKQRLSAFVSRRAVGCEEGDAFGRRTALFLGRARARSSASVLAVIGKKIIHCRNRFLLDLCSKNNCKALIVINICNNPGPVQYCYVTTVSVFFRHFRKTLPYHIVVNIARLNVTPN